MTEAGTEPQVELSVEIEARADTVWRILTTPELFGRWMEAEASFEARVGSPFRAAFPRFSTVIAGEIAELDEEARRISFTWGVESGPQAETLPAGSSRVTFRIDDAEGGVRVLLTHEGLSPQEAPQHEGGWRFHLGRLALAANRRDVAAGLERTLEPWFAAWNEPDAERRAELLEACCDEDVVYRDDWGVASDRGVLSQHIGNTHTFVPDWHVEGEGEPRVCRGEALVGWRGTGHAAEEIEGTYHFRVDRAGRIRRITSFSGP